MSDRIAQNPKTRAYDSFETHKSFRLALLQSSDAIHTAISPAAVMLIPLKSTSKELMQMKLMRRGAIAAMAVGSMAGGAVGATVLSAASSSAATTSPTATAAAPSTAPQGAPPYGAQGPGGVFHSNENATHEKSESAQREAQETAGKFPTVP